MGDSVEKIEWLHQSFVTEWPELERSLLDLSPESPESVFIRAQIIVCWSCFFAFPGAHQR